MSVYVDKPHAQYGRMKMCHMVADTHIELMDMVAKLVLHPGWIQKQGTAEEHFDVCMSKRKDAIRLGAKEINRQQLVAVIQGKRLEEDV